jgi:hypothetical protein
VDAVGDPASALIFDLNFLTVKAVSASDGRDRWRLKSTNGKVTIWPSTVEPSPRWIARVKPSDDAYMQNDRKPSKAIGKIYQPIDKTMPG